MATLRGKNNYLLEIIKCPFCQEYMYQYIATCVTGHSLCSKCKSKEDVCPQCQQPFGTQQNFLLEDIISQMEFPCTYKNQGCSKYEGMENLKKHEMYCRYKTDWCCPMNYFKCNWKGSYHDMYNHICLNHKSQTVQPRDRRILKVLEQFIRLKKIMIIKCFCHKNNLFQIYMEKFEKYKTVELIVMYCGPKEKVASIFVHNKNKEQRQFEKFNF